MKKNKINIFLIIGITIVFIGTLLPAIRIANENISFLKDNGPIIIILSAIMVVLYKLEKKEFIFIPSLLSVLLIIKFINNNKDRLSQINEIYNCYADYQYGLAVMLIGNMIILLTLVIGLINFEKISEFINLIIKKIKNKPKNKQEKTNSIKEKVSNIKETITTKVPKKNKSIITQETTKDGEIKFKKIVVKCDNKETKKRNNKLNIKSKINDLLFKIKLKKISHKKLSITKFKDDYQKEETKIKNLITYKIPVIDIKKWTRKDVCCINCGATVSANSEYCFLCDCKMKLSESKEKLS